LGLQYIITQVQEEKKHRAYIPVFQTDALEQKCYKVMLLLPSEKHVWPRVNICSDPVRTDTCPASRESLHVTDSVVLCVRAVIFYIETRQRQRK
jgi:hypothetical protein